MCVLLSITNYKQLQKQKKWQTLTTNLVTRKKCLEKKV